MPSVPYILISPYSQRLRSGKPNAKNYPHWAEVVYKLRSKGYQTIQIGLQGDAAIGADSCRLNASLDDIKKLVRQTAVWVSVDTFLVHLARSVGKSGVAIYSKSDPLLFGYAENINLLKDRKYLRSDQWRWWEDVAYDPLAFVSADEVIAAIDSLVGETCQKKSNNQKKRIPMSSR